MKIALHQIALLIGLLAIFPACDEVTEIRSATSSSRPNASSKLEKGLRVFFSNDGLEALWSNRLSRGLEIDVPAEQLATVSGSVQVGPLVQRIVVGELSAFPQQDGLTTMSLSFDDLQLTIPARFLEQGSTVICRWQISAQNVTSAANIAVTEDGQGFGLRPVSLPTTQLGRVRLDPVGACPVRFQGESGALVPLTREDFEDALRQYATSSISQATFALLSSSPLDLLGVSRSGLDISRPQSRPIKQGTWTSYGELSSPASDALTLRSTGFFADLDYAFSFQAAPCAPRLELDPLIAYEGEPEPLDPSLVSDAGGAMFGLSISRGSIERVAQSLTRSGFFCAGFDSPGTSSQSVSIEDLELEMIQIDASMLGSRAQYALYPTSLPRVSFDQSMNTLDVSFEKVGLDLYADLFGTSTLLAHLELGAQLSLRFSRASAGFVALTLDSLEVTDSVAVDSPWRVSPEPLSEELARQWGRRVLLLILGDELMFPIPLQGEVVTSFVDYRIRSEDVLLFLEL